MKKCTAYLISFNESVFLKDDHIVENQQTKPATEILNFERMDRPDDFVWASERSVEIMESDFYGYSEPIKSLLINLDKKTFNYENAQSELVNRY
jgi:hypothetical protein